MTEKKTSEFDFDAWLGKASAPEREVVLYATNAVQADIARLEQQRRDILAVADDDSGASWGAPAPAETAARDTTKIDAELAKLRKQIEASGITFRVRALDPDDEAEIDRAHPMPKNAENDVVVEVMQTRLLGQIAKQVFQPRTFTVEELRKLRKAIGEPEFTKLAQACVESRSDSAASTPFWRANSGNGRN